MVVASTSSVLPVEVLHEVFRQRAAATHRYMSFRRTLKLRIGEETLTDVNLVELDVALRAHVVTRQFNRREEGASSGADWLWCIGRPGRWLNILVQAKLADPAASTVHQLHYKDGNQLKTLLNYARPNQFLPLYCIYTGETQGFSDACPLSVDVPQLGCGLVRTRHVANMFRRPNKKNDKALLLQAAVPWAHLFCPALEDASADLADTIVQGILRMDLPNVFPKPLGKLSKKKLDAQWTAALEGRDPSLDLADFEYGGDEWWGDDDFLGDPSRLIAEELPSIARAALHGEHIQDSPVAGVMVISSESLRDDLPPQPRPRP